MVFSKDNLHKLKLEKLLKRDIVDKWQYRNMPNIKEKNR